MEKKLKKINNIDLKSSEELINYTNIICENKNDFFNSKIFREIKDDLDKEKKEKEIAIPEYEDENDFFIPQDNNE